MYTWNKINNAIRIARDDVDVSELTYESTVHEICYELSKIYFSTLLVKESFAILENVKGVLLRILHSYLNRKPCFLSCCIGWLDKNQSKFGYIKPVGTY